MDRLGTKRLVKRPLQPSGGSEGGGGDGKDGEIAGHYKC